MLGSTIICDYRGKRYYFDVVGLRSALRGERVTGNGCRWSRCSIVIDCDIAAEVLRAKAQLKPKKKKRDTN